jgi:hypothetical protein
MMLIPSVIAAPNENANTKGLKITDLSKGTMKEIKDDKVKGMKASSNDIMVEEKGKNHIKLKDSKPSKVPNEHKKVKVSIPETELKSIDSDGDGKFGVLETSNGIVINQYIATTKQLTGGVPMTFSEVEVNGFSGYREQVFTNSAPNAVLDIVDVTGDYVMTAKADGTIPVYVAGPNTSGALAYWSFDNTLEDQVGNYDITAEAPGPYYADSHTGRAIVLNNTYKAYTTIPTTFGQNSTGYSFWVQSADTRTESTLLSQNYGQTTSIYCRMLSSGARIVSYLRYLYPAIDKSVEAPIVQNSKSHHAVVYNKADATLKTYLNGVLVDTETGINTSVTYAGGANVLRIGYRDSVPSAIALNGTIDELVLYNYAPSASTIISNYANGSGITFATSDMQFTGYNVASNAEKIISDGGSVSSVKYLDTTGATRTITIKVYYTADTTISTETSTDDFYNASVVFSPSVAMTNGTIARLIPPNYTGTAVLDSNNTNAVMTQNRTHYTIYTGTLTAGSWAVYNVSVPNNADHGMWLNILMQWSDTISGWVFGETAPTDYINDISDEINVTVT